MIKQSNKILKVFKFFNSLSYCAGCCYSPYVLCFQLDGARPFEWTLITLWLIDIFVGLMEVHDIMEPPFLYGRLILYNLANLDTILDIFTSVLGLIFTCIENNQVVQFIFCLRIFQPAKFQYALEKALGFLFKKQHSTRTMTCISILKYSISFLLYLHFIACAWISIGLMYRDDPSYKSWIQMQDTKVPDSETNPFGLYVLSIYIVMQTIVTVGYGDYCAVTKQEYIFMIFIEFMGIMVMSVSATTITNLFKKSINFKDQMREKTDIRDIWVKRLEQPLHPQNLPHHLYLKIHSTVVDTFMHNHSLLINDEFNLYQKLTHRMQTDLIKLLFGDFIKKFNYFFKSLE